MCKRDFRPPEAKNRSFFNPPPEGERLAPLGGRFVLPTKTAALVTTIALPPPRGLLLGQAPGAKATFFYRATKTKSKKLSPTAF
jgi:hypothetical protein